MELSRILIVKDEITIARELKAQLQGMGYEVSAIAHTGAEAIQIANETRPDLIVMDIALKGDMNGIEAAAEIRRLYDVPIIYLTAHTDNEILDQAKVTEPYAYLVKPFSERELHVNLKMALYKHRTESGHRRMERWFTAAMDDSADAVITTDPEGLITTCNPSAEAITGWKGGQAIGRGLIEVLRLTQRTNGEAVSLEHISDGPIVCLADETLLLDHSDESFPIDCTISSIREEGREAGIVAVFRDPTSQKRGVLNTLNKEVAFAAAQALTLQGMLQLCAESVFRNLNAALARIWTLNAAGDTLLLQTSWGMEEAPDDPYREIPLGKFKVGWIAQEKQPILSNEVLFDPTVSDPEWARRERLVAFAGYPLVVDGRLVGVLAIFSRRSLSESVLDELGSVSLTIGVGIERKQAEAKLQDSEARYRHILETSREMIITSDAQMNISFVSQQVFDMLGYTPEEIIGRSLLEIMPEAVHENIRRHTDLRRAGLSEQYDFRFIHKDGSPVWGLISAISLKDESGGFAGSSATVMNITERKQAEEERDRFFSLSQDLLSISDVEGYFKRINPAWTRVLGWTEAELLSRPFIEFVHPDDRATTLAQMAGIRQGKSAFKFENRYRCSDNSYRWLLWGATPDLEWGLIYAVASDITDRKRLETELQESRDRLEIALESGQIGLWDIDLMNNTIQYSSQWYRLLGYTEEEVGNTPDGWDKLIHPEDIPNVLADMQQLIEGKSRSFRGECRMLHKDGDYRWILTTGTVYHHPSNVAYRMVGSNLDITERKRMEVALQNERDFVSAVVETVGSLVVVLDPQGHIVRFNRTCEQTTGYSFEEVKGRNILDMVLAPEEREAVTQVFEDTCAGQSPNTYENFWIIKDGSRRLISWFNSALLDAQGKVEYIIGTGTDITERKRAEEVLRQSEMQKAAVLHSALDCIISMDDTGRVIEFNPAAEKTFGHTREEAIGQLLGDLIVPAAVREQHRRGLSHYLATGEGSFLNKRIEVNAMRANGTEFLVELAIAPVHLDNRVIFTGHLRDITERKRMEEERNSILRHARCILWSAEIHKGGSESEPSLDWSKLRFDEEAAQSVLPLEILPGEIYNNSWERSRHPDDRHRMHVTSMGAFLSGATSYQQEFRSTDKNGAEHWLNEDVSIQPLGEGQWRAIGVVTEITERKESELMIRRVIQGAHCLLWTALVKEVDGAYQWTLSVPDPDAAERFLPLEREPEEDFSEAWGRGRLPEDNEACYERAELALREGWPGYNQRYRCRDVHGNIHWLAEDVLIERIADDQWSMVGVCLDVTERKRDEEALREGEERFRSYFELGLIGMAITSPTKGFYEVNAELCRILGCERDEMLRMSWTEMTHPDDLAADLVQFNRVMAGEIDGYALDKRWIRRDGGVVDTIISVKCVRREDGSVDYFVALLQDVTERKRAEVKLGESLSLLRSVIDGTTDAIFAQDVQGRYLMINKGGASLLGMRPEEIIGKDNEQLFSPETARLLIEADRRIMRSDETRNYEETVVAAGREITYLSTKGPLFDESGNVIGLFGIARDVTPLKDAEAALQKANDGLELRVIERTAELEASHREMSVAKQEADAANHAKSEFLSRMSHELRTPMNSILGFAQIMEMNAPDEKQAQRIQYILKAGNHLLELINEVLDLAQVESGRLQLSPEPVAVQRVVEGAVDLIRPLCQQRGQSILLDWGGCESLFVLADQQRLSQVLLNLLSNAHKYNCEGGEVSVRCERREDRIGIRISDRGPGIAHDLIPRLFQPFERLNANDSTVEGTGLGLALSRGIMESMHGTIGVESVPGTGSTFWIELPLAANPIQHVEGASSPETFLGPEDREFTLLCIEDNPANLKVIEHVLANDTRIQLTTAVYGKIGLELARERCPSLILLDLHLPDLPGEEVLRRLQADPLTQNVPVIVVSAVATPKQISRLKSLGAAEYLTKPLDIRHFIEVVYRLLLSH